MPSKGMFQMKIKAILFISLLCLSLGFVSAKNQDKGNEQSKKTPKTMEAIRAAESEQKLQIRSAQVARNSDNDRIFVPSEPTKKEISDLNKLKAKIQSVEEARKRRNDKIFVPSEPTTREINDLLKMRIFPVDI